MDTTGLETSTEAEILEGDYSPPVLLSIQEKKYTPIHWEKNLIVYNLTMTQGISPNGSLGTIYFNIKIDSSKNIIKTRFEILDL